MNKKSLSGEGIVMGSTATRTIALYCLFAKRWEQTKGGLYREGTEMLDPMYTEIAPTTSRGRNETHEKSLSGEETEMLDQGITTQMLDQGITTHVINMEVAESLAPDDQKFKDHLDTIKEREQLLETQMCKLTQEMLAVSLYIQKSTVVLENCKLTVQLTIRKQLDVKLELKETGKGRDKYTTWKDLLGDNWKELLGEKRDELLKEMRKGKNAAKVACFSFTRDWKLANRNFPPHFLRLLPAARILASEELEKLQTRAQEDIEYLKVLEGGRVT